MKAPSQHGFPEDRGMGVSPMSRPAGGRSHGHLARAFPGRPGRVITSLPRNTMWPEVLLGHRMGAGSIMSVVR